MPLTRALLPKSLDGAICRFLLSSIFDPLEVTEYQPSHNETALLHYLLDSSDKSELLFVVGFCPRAEDADRMIHRKFVRLVAGYPFTGHESAHLFHWASIDRSSSNSKIIWEEDLSDHDADTAARWMPWVLAIDAMVCQHERSPLFGMGEKFMAAYEKCGHDVFLCGGLPDIEGRT